MNPRHKLNWLQPTDNIPEMDLEDCRKLLKECFGIGSTFVEGSKNLYRFVGGGLNEFVPETPARTISATKRGTNWTFDPITVLSLLDKFGISEEEFRNAYNSLYSSPPPPNQPPELTSSKPN